jgi:hypothetical protein
MSALQPVSFKNGRGHQPRLSAPYVPGKRSKRYWSAGDIAVLKEYYPKGSAAAVLARLPDKTLSGVYVKAQQLSLTAGRGEKIVPKAGFDDRLRKFYQEGDGRAKGECNAFADKEKLPRWWVTKRATKLGLVRPHRKEPPWTKRELALMPKLPLHDPDKCAEIMRQHGFRRSPTAIMVKSKRLNLSRRFREAMSARAVAKILGVDDKNVTADIIRGDLKAGRRKTRRLVQQGGDWWTVSAAQLRRYILDHLERIDLRKVDKVAFVQIVAGEPLEKIEIPSRKKTGRAK